MLNAVFDIEEWRYFSNHQWTPLHNASNRGHFEVIKYLIEKGADVNSVWSPLLLMFRMNAFTLISNFNDPFYQQFINQVGMSNPHYDNLIENGMI